MCPLEPHETEEEQSQRTSYTWICFGCRHFSPDTCFLALPLVLQRENMVQNDILEKSIIFSYIFKREPQFSLLSYCWHLQACIRLPPSLDTWGHYSVFWEMKANKTQWSPQKNSWPFNRLRFFIMPLSRDARGLTLQRPTWSILSKNKKKQGAEVSSLCHQWWAFKIAHHLVPMSSSLRQNCRGLSPHVSLWQVTSMELVVAGIVIAC